MVSLSAVQASNARIATTLPPRLVAVFVGGTSGLGEYTLKQFAKHARQPRVYFIGRSQEAADRITAECKTLNPEGEYIFMKVDVSLIRNVDTVCDEIKRKESAINLLVLSTGTFIMGKETAEGLYFICSLVYHARIRFIGNLLPSLHKATGLRRVLSIFTGGKEGLIDTNEFQGRKMKNPIKSRGHAASMMTLALIDFSKQAPDVSFIHDFPGAVKSGITRGEGVQMAVMRGLFFVLGPFFKYIPNEESGEHHVFLATSARYPAAVPGGSGQGVPLADSLQVATGIDGKTGSGVYCPDEVCEAAGPQSEELMARLETDGTAEKLRVHTEGEFRRIEEL